MDIFGLRYIYTGIGFEEALRFEQQPYMLNGHSEKKI